MSDKRLLKGNTRVITAVVGVVIPSIGGITVVMSDKGLLKGNTRVITTMIGVVIPSVGNSGAITPLVTGVKDALGVDILYSTIVK